MKKFTEQLQKKANTVSLQAAERRLLRERVVSYMEYHPLKEGVQQSKPTKVARPVFETYRTITFPFNTKQIFQAGFAFSFLLFMVTPVMAEQAVPGDVLYRIKVQVNEPIRSTFAFTPHQKVEWETELVNRRLAEARILAKEGKLTVEVEEAIAIAVKSHTENATREIAVLREQDAEEAVLAEIAFTTTLEVQSTALRDAQSLAVAAGAPSLLETVINDTLTLKQAVLLRLLFSHQKNL